MNTVQRGDVWLVNLDPTMGREIKKTRPCIIIQNDEGNRYSDVTIIAPITSQHAENLYPFEARVPKTAGVDVPSKALLNQIRAVDKQRLMHKLGHANQDCMNDVNEAIKISLGLVAIA